jgi:sodium-dependent dicarboxylate transporter 2/3/5
MRNNDRSVAAFDPSLGRRGHIGLVLGPIIFAALILSPAPADLSAAGWRTAAVAALMAIWWVTEAIPLPATGLLPLALFPLFGVTSIRDAAAPFAHPVIFLFMGGFFLALAMERWALHRRIALHIIRAIGTQPRRIIAGFMASAAFLSMWISNTATTLLLLPIGLSVLGLSREAPDNVGDDSPGADFAPALLLAIAFAASVGGIGTLIGTPPNALTAAFIEETYGIRIGFARWLLVGLPMVAVGLPLIYMILTRLAFRVGRTELPGGDELVEREIARLGSISAGERRVAIVFALAAAAWVTRPLLQQWVPGITDAGIAVIVGLALFTVPGDLKRDEFLLNWTWAQRLPWGVLLLFGGGLSLASAIDRSGLAAWLADSFAALGGWPIAAILLLVIVSAILFSELASNTATAAAFLPVVGALAISIGVEPLHIVIPAGLAASGGYMLPVATPPNAIVYSTGHVTVPQLVRAGALLDLVFVAVVTGIGYVIVPRLFS